MNVYEIEYGTEGGQPVEIARHLISPEHLRIESAQTADGWGARIFLLMPTDEINIGEMNAELAAQGLPPKFAAMETL